VAKTFGIVSYDWSNAKAQWAKQHPMDCEERLIQQAQMTKAASADTRVFIYQNLVKCVPTTPAPPNEHCAAAGTSSHFCRFWCCLCAPQGAALVLDGS